MSAIRGATSICPVSSVRYTGFAQGPAKAWAAAMAASTEPTSGPSRPWYQAAAAIAGKPQLFRYALSEPLQDGSVAERLVFEDAAGQRDFPSDLPLGALASPALPTPGSSPTAGHVLFQMGGSTELDARYVVARDAGGARAFDNPVERSGRSADVLALDTWERAQAGLFLATDNDVVAYLDLIGEGDA